MKLVKGNASKLIWVVLGKIAGSYKLKQYGRDNATLPGLLSIKNFQDYNKLKV